jgi:hypothetical protein
MRSTSSIEALRSASHAFVSTTKRSKARAPLTPPERVVQLGLAGERLDECPGLAGHQPGEAGDGCEPLDRALACMRARAGAENNSGIQGTDAACHTHWQPFSVAPKRRGLTPPAATENRSRSPVSTVTV